MPGAGFKHKAREWRAFVDMFIALPFDAVKADMQKGGAVPSFTSLALRDIKEGDDRKYEEELIKGVAATTYTGMTQRLICALARVLTPCGICSQLVRIR